MLLLFCKILFIQAASNTNSVHMIPTFERGRVILFIDTGSEYAYYTLMISSRKCVKALYYDIRAIFSKLMSHMM